MIFTTEAVLIISEDLKLSLLGRKRSFVPNDFCQKLYEAIQYSFAKAILSLSLLFPNKINMHRSTFLILLSLVVLVSCNNQEPEQPLPQSDILVGGPEKQFAKLGGYYWLSPSYPLLKLLKVSHGNGIPDSLYAQVINPDSFSTPSLKVLLSGKSKPISYSTVWEYPDDFQYDTFFCVPPIEPFDSSELVFIVEGKSPSPHVTLWANSSSAGIHLGDSLCPFIK